MNGVDEYPKFTSSLRQFISEQWSKLQVSDNSLKAARNFDEILEEEYNTLVREIEFLTSEKTCHLSFKNDHFNNAHSSKDLIRVLKEHSDEVLKTYIAHLDKEVKTNTLGNRKDLINYITEIIISPPKCNNKVCTCKLLKTSKEVLTDVTFFKENTIETHTPSACLKFGNAGINVNCENIEIQTDDLAHDPHCICGYCPKTAVEVTTTSVATVDKELRNATTSDKKITLTKRVLANCLGDSVEASTSTNKLCMPENFETLLNANEVPNFTSCSMKQDCGCDAYDAKEAIKRGLILPSSDMCIQSKAVKKTKMKISKKGNKHESSTSERSGTATETSISEITKLKKKKVKERKGGKGEIESGSTEMSDSGSYKPQRNVKKKKRQKIGCFGSRKKTRGCDEYCQGIVGRQRAIQTTPIEKQDTSEGTQSYEENDKKIIQISANSEVGTQISARQSEEKFKKIVEDKEEFTQGPEHTGETNYQTGKDRNSRNQGHRDIPNEGVNYCNKCGRQKRECIPGCRNTIILPYGSRSNGALRNPGEAESLRMLIKLQSKDTSRHLDNIMAELNHQKSEIRRLNDMYTKMVESFYGPQKPTESHSKNPSNTSYECGCSKYRDKRPETGKPCGCSFSNECHMDNKSYSPPIRSTDDKYYARFSTNNRRFGPPNTAVAINMCDTCTVEIGENIRTCYSSGDQGYPAGDKQRKEQLNQCKKARYSNQNDLITKNNSSPEEKSDLVDRKRKSISTIYNTRRYNNTHQNASISSINSSNMQALPETQIKLDTMEESMAENSNSGTKSRNSYSSRMLIWLKRSWITIKHKRQECQRKEENHQQDIGGLSNFCKNTAKQAVVRLWKSMKN